MKLIIRKIIQKPKSKMKQDKLDKAIVAICFLVLGICMVLFYLQEDKKDKKLKECSYFTVGYPIRIVKNTLEFYFSVNDKKILSFTSTGAEVVGPFYNTSQLLNRKLWVKFNCMDPNINRVSWNIDMPDSLNFVPKQGWKALPYNLKEKDKTIFDEN